MIEVLNGIGIISVSFFSVVLINRFLNSLNKENEFIVKGDPFRPRYDPARTIYDAFQKVAIKRDEYEDLSWMDAEVEAVFESAKEWCLERDLIFPTIEEVKGREVYASGHIDFGKKWAFEIADLIIEKNRDYFRAFYQ